jgi:hypothetical protein
MTETYRAEELDSATRDYLMQARKREGNGLPGICSVKSDYLPIVSLFAGFIVILLTMAVTLPPTENPIREAMLQTAGFLLGGWMIVAAFRLWLGVAGGSQLGKFTYADPDFLYEVKGSTLQITDLGEIEESKIDHNYNDETYRNSVVKLKFPKEVVFVPFSNEVDGNQFNVFFNAVAYMRHGGDDGNDQALQNLSSEEMGDVASQVVETGSFPRNLQGAHSDFRIPHPQRTGRPSTGILPILITIGIGVVMFMGFRLFNEPFRDETIFARIKSLPPKEQPPHLRHYLAHDKFTRHRDEAQKLLEDAYDRSVTQNVLGKHEEAKKGFSQTLLSLKKQPQPVISVKVTEEGGDPTAKKTREDQIAKDLADRWGATVGDELVFFVQISEKEIKSLIDINYKLLATGLEYTLEFRTSPDAEPHAKYTGVVPTPPNRSVVDAFVQTVVEQTIGQSRLRPPPPPTDGDF